GLGRVVRRCCSRCMHPHRYCSCEKIPAYQFRHFIFLCGSTSCVELDHAHRRLNGGAISLHSSPKPRLVVGNRLESSLERSSEISARNRSADHCYPALYQSQLGLAKRLHVLQEYGPCDA